MSKWIYRILSGVIGFAIGWNWAWYLAWKALQQ